MKRSAVSYDAALRCMVGLRKGLFFCPRCQRRVLAFFIIYFLPVPKVYPLSFNHVTKSLITS